MSVENKVDKIFNMIDSRTKDDFTSGGSYIAGYEEEIKEAIQKVIDAGNDYLLTSGFVDHLIRDANWVSSLVSMGYIIANDILDLNDEDKRMLLISKYMHTLGNTLDVYPDHISKFEYDLIEIYLNNTARRLCDMPNKEYVLIRRIFEVIAAYIVINKKSLDEYKMIIEDYLSNLDSNLDEISIQICLEYDYKFDVYNVNYKELIPFVLSRLNKSENKEIR